MTTTRRREEANEGQFQKFQQLARAMGLRATPQRLAVLKALISSHEHPSAETIYKQLKPVYKALSLATVHRTLETLVQKGEARKVTPLHLRARYDGRKDKHHHLMCTNCHKVLDLDDPELDRLARRRVVNGFEVSEYAVEVRGLCPDCRRAKS
jgi:Fur family peroxide stress response transcriptional regulator